MKSLLTPKQVAQAIGVSESSLKRWCDKGLLPTTRTAGGHRRIPMADVVQFLRTAKEPLVRPELLGLPSQTGQGKLVISRAVEQFQAALLAGDEDQARRIVFDLYLGESLAYEICDSVIAPAFRAIGDGWEHGQLHVYEERRACEICQRVLYELRGMLPRVAEDAPRAIGGTLEGDTYRLPTAVVEIALREAGWQAESYGVELPLETIAAAIEKVRPKLVWISVSGVVSDQDFVARYRRLFQCARLHGAAVVIGGRELTPQLRNQIEYAAYCDNLRHLVAFVEALRKN
ncbi:MAG: B12-binding domain-containing protein [Pirellulales bacterium]|nr:B12-binding domain-containing protein [Pirellulales bacterium]